MTIARLHALRTLLLTEPAFDYTDIHLCVYPLVRQVLGLGVRESHDGYAARMGVTPCELGYLLGGCRMDVDPQPHKGWDEMTQAEAQGDAGRAEALRRVAVVLQRYEVMP